MARLMGGGSTNAKTTARRWLRVLATLNEAQARWFVADKALDLVSARTIWISGASFLRT